MREKWSNAVTFIKKKAFARPVVVSLISVTAAVTIGAVSVLSYFGARAAQLDMGELGKIPERSVIVDINGKPYSRVPGENRIVVPLNKVSDKFVKALLAREDTRFYRHGGIDYYSIGRAFTRNIRHLAITEGGSTLTQQLARNSFPLGGPKSFKRKTYEVMVAWRIEKNFSKDQILEFYVNRIYFGSGIWGVETASQFYFGKPSSDLSLDEAAMLAGMIRCPNRLSPNKNFKAAMVQRNVVLKRMKDLGMITEKEATEAKNRETAVVSGRALNVQESYAMDAVRRELDVILTPDQVDRGGLRIYTTIDSQLQKLAEAAVDQKLTKIESELQFKKVARNGKKEAKAADGLQGALIAIDNRTGGIVAVVGGRNYKQSEFNRALQAKRQIGSTFKPFVYAAGVKKGILPGTLIDDSPLRSGELGTLQARWNPENAKENYLGQEPVEVGLIQSRNMMTIRVGEMAGLDEVAYIAGTAALGDNIPKLPSIYLGAFETTLENLTAAYSIFPNGGIRKKPYVVERVEDRAGETVYQAAHEQQVGLEVDVAQVVSKMLEQVLQRGTAAGAKSMGFHGTGAGKTGTTNNYRDAWFVGYTTSLTCGVWVGFDQPQQIMPGGYGSALALPIWADFMGSVPEKTYASNTFPELVSTTEMQLCSRSGERATDACEAAGTSYEAQLPVTLLPTTACRFHSEHPQASPVIVASNNTRPINNMDAAPPPAPAPAPASAVQPTPTIETAPAPEPNSSTGIIRTQVVVCSASGDLAHTACDNAGTSYPAMLSADEVPKQKCRVHQEIIAAEAVDESEIEAEE